MIGIILIKFIRNIRSCRRTRLGLKWSPELSNRSFLAVNGTLLTAKLAMKEGIACHVAGGTHHSHFDFGSGYCVFNDLAYTSRSLIENKIISKVLIFDCDVHQGDGTAKILEKIMIYLHVLFTVKITFLLERQK